MTPNLFYRCVWDTHQLLENKDAELASIKQFSPWMEQIFNQVVMSHDGGTSTATQSNGDEAHGTQR